MIGWKTYLSAALTIAYALGGIVLGYMELNEAVIMIIGALALLGIGGKANKIIKELRK